jgi:hypothetical protein
LSIGAIVAARSVGVGTKSSAADVSTARPSAAGIATGGTGPVVSGAPETIPATTLETASLPPDPPADPEEQPDPKARTARPPISVTLPAAKPGVRCQPVPLSNVYQSLRRLTQVAQCVTVTGTVTSVAQQVDADIRIIVALDPAYSGLLNEFNQSGAQGGLVVKVVPADQPGCTVGTPPKPPTQTYQYGVCTGANVATPQAGNRVEVTGAYVFSNYHGWMELHPAWSIRLIDVNGGSVQPVTTAPKATTVTTAPKATATTASKATKKTRPSGTTATIPVTTIPVTTAAPDVG